jgi:hypothetical protein
MGYDIPSGDSNIGKSQLCLAMEVSIMGKPLNLIWGIFEHAMFDYWRLINRMTKMLVPFLRHPRHGKPLGMPGIAQENMASWGIHNMSHWDKNTRLSLPHIPQYNSVFVGYIPIMSPFGLKYGAMKFHSECSFAP